MLDSKINNLGEYATKNKEGNKLKKKYSKISDVGKNKEGGILNLTLLCKNPQNQRKLSDFQKKIRQVCDLSLKGKGFQSTREQNIF